MLKKLFMSDDIDRLLRAIDNALTRKVKVLMIGGGAMSVRGQKTATKDIDLVFTDRGEHEEFIGAITKMGFEPLRPPVEEYRKMGARIYVDKEGHWLDIFLERICNMFLVHKKIMERAEE